METIADFAVKPFSSKAQTPLKTSQVTETVFSTNWAGFDPLNDNWENKDYSRTRPQGQELEIGP